MKAKERKILYSVCNFYNVEPAFLLENKKSRKTPLPEIKHVCSYLFYMCLNYSFKNAACVLSLKNHSSGVHSKKVVEKKMEKDVGFRSKINSLLSELTVAVKEEKSDDDYTRRKNKKHDYKMFVNGKLNTSVPRGFNFLTGYKETNIMRRFSKFEPNITIYK